MLPRMDRSDQLRHPRQRHKTLFEAQFATRSVEDVVGREIRPELGVVLGGDRLVADADQLSGQGLSEMKAGILPLLLRNGW